MATKKNVKKVTKKKSTRRTTYLAKAPNGLKAMSVYRKLVGGVPSGYYIIRSDGVVKYGLFNRTPLTALFSKVEVESGMAAFGSESRWTTKKLSRREALRAIASYPGWHEDR